MDSWIAFWPFILAVGAMYAAIAWLIGGWWYRVQLKWAGVAKPDPFSARNLLVGLSAVLSTLVHTLVFESYRGAGRQTRRGAGCS